MVELGNGKNLKESLLKFFGTYPMILKMKMAIANPYGRCLICVLFPHLCKQFVRSKWRYKCGTPEQKH